MRIVFLGTPVFAVASLKAMIEAGFDVAGVVTAPDKPAGRGMQLQQSPVKQFALEHGLKVLQPEKLRDPGFLSELKALDADLQVVIAFRMLPEAVWNMPPKGTVNLHASLLPDYRGAAPINWAIINGEKETGVCTFFLKQEIDTGNIIMSDKCPITETMTAGELHDKLMNKGASLIVNTLRAIEDGSYTTSPQPEITGKHAPKIFTETCEIKWNQPVNEAYNLIRGLSPYPAAFTNFNDKSMKIYEARKETTAHHVQWGEYETDGKSFLRFACPDGWIYAESIQLQGKKRMQVTEFLRGYRA